MLWNFREIVLRAERAEHKEAKSRVSAKLNAFRDIRHKRRRGLSQDKRNQIYLNVRAPELLNHQDVS